MQITIKTIPHADQRYPTVGDWVFVDENNLQIRVSDLGDRRYNALVAVHELVEALLCQHRGISTEAADTFDMNWGQIGENYEPGDCWRAPYRDQHCFATAVERMLCAAMGAAWDKYADAVTAL